MCCVMPPASPSATLVSTDRIEQRGLAVIYVTHDSDHRRTRRDFDGGLFSAASGCIDIFRCLLFESDDVRLSSEEARHIAGEFGVERLVDSGKNAAAEQARDQIFRANVEFLRQILNADAFRDRDIARDRHGLVRHHHTRWRRVALHWTFFYATRNVALAGPARRRSRTAAGTRWPRRRKPRTNTKRTCTRRRLTRGMHGTALAGTQRTRRASAGNLRTRALKNRLTGHGASRRGTHGTCGSTGLRGGRDRARRRSFVYRTRPSLRNDHARCRRLRRTCHCRRRWRTRHNCRRLRCR